jgi:hypothetical protein
LMLVFVKVMSVLWVIRHVQLSLNSKLRQGDDHNLKTQRTFQPTRGSNARDKTALKSDCANECWQCDGILMETLWWK